jgi:hypothetical protein
MIGTHLADFIMVRVVKTQKETGYMAAIPVHFFQENTGIIGSVHIWVYGVSAFCMTPTRSTIRSSYLVRWYMMI